FVSSYFFFFFQAEDGIRDFHVTGVQTCALPIFELARVLRYPRLQAVYGLSEEEVYNYIAFLRDSAEIVSVNPLVTAPIRDVNDRSEERRVGKECVSREWKDE